ncbi:hypothetical protein ACFQX6_60470 [Streptosporangium lutulentum]
MRRLTRGRAAAHAGTRPDHDRPWIAGADVSSLAKSEALGGVYRSSNGKRGDALAILESAASTTSG